MKTEEAEKLVYQVAGARGWSNPDRDKALALVEEATGWLGFSADELAVIWPSRPELPGWDKLGAALGVKAQSYSVLDNVSEQALEFGDDVSGFSGGVGKVAGAAANIAEEAGESPYTALIVIGAIAVLAVIVLLKLS